MDRRREQSCDRTPGPAGNRPGFAYSSHGPMAHRCAHGDAVLLWVGAGSTWLPRRRTALRHPRSHSSKSAAGRHLLLCCGHCAEAHWDWDVHHDEFPGERFARGKTLVGERFSAKRSTRRFAVHPSAPAWIQHRKSLQAARGERANAGASGPGDMGPSVVVARSFCAARRGLRRARSGRLCADGLGIRPARENRTPADEDR
jgi:hypothetical protein